MIIRIIIVYSNNNHDNNNNNNNNRFIVQCKQVHYLFCGDCALMALYLQTIFVLIGWGKIGKFNECQF